MAIQPPPETLKRELGIFGASLLGLGSIIGTGVFVSIGIAAGIAGPAVILSIILAAILASCNALSSAQLAAAHPVSGGTYEYGYRLLHPWMGFTAGWVFLCAKSASAATAALGAAGYALHLAGYSPQSILPWFGLAISVLITGLVLSGLKRSNNVNILIVSFTILVLVIFSFAGLFNIATQDVSRNFTPFFSEFSSPPFSGVLYGTALMFVAYTGYGRIATMGEEVKNPRKTIPRAIIITLIISAFLYICVAIAAIGAAGPTMMSNISAGTVTPLEKAARALNIYGLGQLVAIGAIIAMLGVLLNLVLGLSRIALAMGRRRDLPPIIARLIQNQTPQFAIVFVGVIISALTLIGDVKTTWSLSAFTVLIYYAITNLAALRLPKAQRLYPRFISWVGLSGCIFLAFFLPMAIWLMGGSIIIIGLLWHVLAQKLWVSK